VNRGIAPTSTFAWLTAVGRSLAGSAASAALKLTGRPSDETGMNLSSFALLLVAGIALTLYIMRRRSRTGKRSPKF